MINVSKGVQSCTTQFQLTFQAIIRPVYQNSWKKLFKLFDCIVFSLSSWTSGWVLD